MKTTITEDYEDGQLVRRTTVTDDEYATGGYVYPLLPGGPTACTCSQLWNSITPPPPCPTHGQAIFPTVVSGSTVTIKASSEASPAQVAEQVGMELRRIA